jgi:hypothetical protein
MSSDNPSYWQLWPGPTGTTGPEYLGVTGSVTGAAFFGITGATGPTGIQAQPSHASYLYDRARVELVGASDAMIRLMMYDMFHEFFNDSKLWVEAIPGILSPSTMLYYLQPGQTQSLGDAFPFGRIVELSSVYDLNFTPVPADMPEVPILRLQYAQSNPLSVFVTVIKNVAKPSSGELPEVPYWAVDTYEPYLLAGIKGMLQLQANRPYYDPKMGPLNYQRFRQGVNMGRVRALRRNTYGSQAWAYPQQFRTRSQRSWGVSVGNSWRM